MGKKKDLTKIQDLSEYSHEDDHETDQLLDEGLLGHQDLYEDEQEDEMESDQFSAQEDDFISLEDLENTSENEYDAPEYEQNTFDEYSLEGTYGSPGKFTQTSTQELDTSDEYDSQNFQVDEELTSDYELPSIGEISEVAPLQSTENVDEDDQPSAVYPNTNHMAYPELPAREDNQQDSNDYQLEVSELSEEQKSESDTSIFKHSLMEVTIDQVEMPELTNKSEAEILDNEKIGLPPLVATRVESDLNQVRDKTPIKEKEAFAQEIKEFAENYSYNIVPSGAHPSFSIRAGNIPAKYHRDVLALIREYKIDSDLTLYEKSLQSDQLLISHISEYLAIVLANKLSRYGANIELAPSHILRQSSSYEAEQPLQQNSHNLHAEKQEELIIPKAGPDAPVFMSTTSYLQGHKIHKYLGIAQDFITLGPQELKDIIHAKELASHEIQDELDEDFFNSKLLIHEFHDQLRESLQRQARKVNGNAIIGLQYKYFHPQRNSYEISCTGTVVYAVKLEEDSLI